MARESGAKKVYIASAAPPVRFPNVYGIDMPTKEELVAYRSSNPDDMCSVENMVAQIIGADRGVLRWRIPRTRGLQAAVQGLRLLDSAARLAPARRRRDVDMWRRGPPAHQPDPRAALAARVLPVIYQALDDLQASITDEAEEAKVSLSTLDSSCFDGQYVTDYVGESYLTNLAKTRTSDRGNSERACAVCPLTARLSCSPLSRSPCHPPNARARLLAISFAAPAYSSSPTLTGGSTPMHLLDQLEIPKKARVR